MFRPIVIHNQPIHLGMTIQQLTLSNLPSDIVSTIVGVGLESVGSMRLISPRWNALATTYFSNRRHLPAIPHFSVAENHYVSERRMTLRMRIPDRLRSYFGVQRWPFRRVSQESEQSEKYVDIRRHFSKGDLNLARLIIWQDNLTKLLAKCSSIQVLDLQVAHCSLDIVEEALKGIAFDAVSFTPTEPGIPSIYVTQYGDTLLEFARNHPVKMLTLYFTDYRTPDWIENFAVDAVTLIPTVVFEVKRDDELWNEMDDSELHGDHDRWRDLANQLNQFVDAQLEEEWIAVEPEQRYVDNDEGEMAEMEEERNSGDWLRYRITATRVIDEDSEMIIDS